MRRLLLLVALAGCAGHEESPSPTAPPAVSNTDPTWFREVGLSAGLSHRREAAEYGTLEGRMSGGVCVLDADGDGRLDLFFPGAQADGGSGAHLYMARGAKLAFIDEALSRGIADVGDGRGCVAADIDGDGDPDLVTTGLGGARLFRNEGGTFVAISPGLSAFFTPDAVATAAVAFDADGDGDLDLAIAVYGKFATPTAPCLGPCRSDILQYTYGATRLLLQKTDGTFEDASDRLGKLAEPGLVMLATDLDADGKADLFVGNDIATFPDRYFHGDGAGNFTEIGAALGVAFNARKSGVFSMSAIDGDLDGDGQLDLIESSWDDEPSALFRCASGACRDVSEEVGLLATPHNFRWGQALADLDDDGVPELFEAAGYYLTTGDTKPGGPVLIYATEDRPILWHRADLARPFQLVAPSDGLLAKTGGRGVVAVDLDDDGDLDVVIGTAHGRPLLLENIRAGRGHGVTLALASGGKNRQGVGARVVVRTPSRATPAIVHAGSGFLSSDGSRVHIGVGAATTADVDVTWPSGKTSHHPGVQVDRLLTLTEP